MAALAQNVLKMIRRPGRGVGPWSGFGLRRPCRECRGCHGRRGDGFHRTVAVFLPANSVGLGSRSRSPITHTNRSDFFHWPLPPPLTVQPQNGLQIPRTQVVCTFGEMCHPSVREGAIIIGTERDDGVHDGKYPVVFGGAGNVLVFLTELSDQFQECVRAVVGSKMMRPPEIPSVL